MHPSFFPSHLPPLHCPIGSSIPTTSVFSESRALITVVADHHWQAHETGFHTYAAVRGSTSMQMAALAAQEIACARGFAAGLGIILAPTVPTPGGRSPSCGVYVPIRRAAIAPIVQLHTILGCLCQKSMAPTWFHAPSCSSRSNFAHWVRS